MVVSKNLLFLYFLQFLDEVLLVALAEVEDERTPVTHLQLQSRVFHHIAMHPHFHNLEDAPLVVSLPVVGQAEFLKRYVRVVLPHTVIAKSE